MWKSIITWPDTVNTGERDPRVSTDNHPAADNARWVCRNLRRYGFGQQGVIFPLAARIEGPNGEKENIF